MSERSRGRGTRGERSDREPRRRREQAEHRRGTARPMMDDTNDPRFKAALEMLQRTGAREFQMRYSDDEQPVVWFAVGRWNWGKRRGGSDGPVAAGGRAVWEVAAALSPLRAVFRLLDQTIDGGRCSHCGRSTGFSEDVMLPTPLDAAVCWFMWDPEGQTFMRSCEATHE
jgi:hypothetical protein